MNVKEKIIQNYMKKKLSSDRKWAIRALICIYNNQTNEEQIKRKTKYINSIGFNSSDACILTELSKFYLERNFLTDKQLNIVYKRIPKYWNQLWKISNQEKIIEQLIMKKEIS